MNMIFAVLSRRACLAACCSGIAVLVLLTGCTRQYYRHQADRDAYRLIAEKQQSDWGVENVIIDVDPASRMHDPNSIDCPPMPPDDPDSHRLMHCVDCKKGYPCWHCNGDTDTVENPYWQSYVPLDEDGVLELTSDDAYRLARIPRLPVSKSSTLEDAPAPARARPSAV